MKTVFSLALMLLGIGAWAQYTYEAVPDYGTIYLASYDLDDENVIYARSESNHIVVSNDDGQSWTHLYQHNMKIGDLKVLPGGANLCFAAYDPADGPGFFILDTETGEIINHVDGPNDNYEPLEIWFDVFDQEGTTILVYTSYADLEGTYQNVYYTSTSGEDWNLVYDYLENDGFHPADVAIGPSDPLKLYIPRNYSATANDGGGLLISGDGGVTWSQVLAGQAITAFAVNPLDQEDLMASISEDGSDENQKIMRSLDAGQTWEEIPMQWTASEYNESIFIDYNSSIAGSLFILDHNEIAYSDDNGETWIHTVYEEQDYIMGGYISSSPFDGYKAIILNSDYSDRTSDGGATLSRLEAPFYRIFDLAVRKTGGADQLFYSCVGGIIHKNYENSVSYLHENVIGKSSTMKVDTYVPGRQLIFEDNWLPPYVDKLYLSLDDGNTKSVLLSIPENSGILLLNSYTCDPANPEILYVVLSSFFSSYLYRFDISNPDAPTYELLSLPDSDFLGLGANQVLYVTSDESETRILLNITNKLYESTNQGETWTTLLTVPEAISIWDISVNPLDENMLGITTDNGIYMSEDKGETWSEFLSDVAARSMRFSDIQQNVMAIELWQEEGPSPAPDRIMYFDGANWHTISKEELTYTMSNGMDFSFEQGIISAYIATEDMGVVKFTFEIGAMGTEHPSAASEQISLVPNPVKDNVRVHMNTATLSKVSIYSINGQKLTEGHSEIIDISALSSGVYLIEVQTLEGDRFIRRLVKK